MIENNEISKKGISVSGSECVVGSASQTNVGTRPVQSVVRHRSVEDIIEAEFRRTNKIIPRKIYG